LSLAVTYEIAMAATIDSGTAKRSQRAEPVWVEAKIDARSKSAKHIK